MSSRDSYKENVRGRPRRWLRTTGSGEECERRERGSWVLRKGRCLLRDGARRSPLACSLHRTEHRRQPSSSDTSSTSNRALTSKDRESLGGQESGEGVQETGESQQAGGGVRALSPCRPTAPLQIAVLSRRALFPTNDRMICIDNGVGRVCKREQMVYT